MHSKEFTILILTLIIALANAQTFEGEDCMVKKTGQNGLCKSIGNCPSVLNDIRIGKFPTVCGYKGFQQVVCCPEEPAKLTTTTERVSPLASPKRISAKKCDEYKEAVYEIQYGLALLGEDPIQSNVSTCAFKTVPLVTGGTEAVGREFPHMALVGFTADDIQIMWLCGGSLISDQYVLTAGHCMNTRDYGPPRYIKLGDHDLDRTDDDADPIQLNIMQRLSSPEYKTSTNYHDIGLLKLERKIQFNRFIRPACLPDRAEVGTEHAIATGWGKVEWNGKGNSALLKVVLEVFSYAECNETYKYDINRKLRNGIVDRTQICAGSHTEAKDTCQGDSGGPLQNYHPTHPCMYTVVGVTSFGKGCGNAGSPGIYTRVFAYLDWIESVVWPNNL